MYRCVLLLNEHHKHNFEILAFVITEGNTGQSFGVLNTFRLLQTANAMSIPVYAGSRYPVLPHKDSLENFFGTDGFGDLEWDNEPEGTVEKVLAPAAIKMFIDKFPNQITYIVVGPMTNLGLAMRMYEGLADSLRNIVAMGGLYRDNGTEDVGEFNIMFDPESAEIVFDQLRSPMSIFTWQACLVNLPIRNWFENATIYNPVFEMMLRAETSLKAMHPEDPLWMSCDPMAVITYLKPESIIASYSSPLTVQLNRGTQRGVIFNYTNTDPELLRYPVQVITEMDMEVMQSVFLSSFEEVCHNTNCKDL